MEDHLKHFISNFEREPTKMPVYKFKVIIVNVKCEKKIGHIIFSKIK